MKILLSFFLIAFGYTMLIGFVSFQMVASFQINLAKPDMVNCLAYYYFLTCLVFYISYLGFKKGSQQAVVFSFASLGIRFLSGLLYVLYFSLTHKTYKKEFAIYFLSLFILFIVFEIYNLTTKLRLDSIENKEQNDSHK